MNFPSISSTIQSVQNDKWTYAPFFLANIILIGLISYRLIKSKDLSNDDKTSISYGELALSFLVSFPTLVFFGLFGILAIFVLITKFDFGPIYFIMFAFLMLVILNPFTLTAVRVGLNDALSDQQQTILSVLAIPISLLSSYITVLINSGFFMY
jgi:hypothetical protein